MSGQEIFYVVQFLQYKCLDDGLHSTFHARYSIRHQEKAYEPDIYPPNQHQTPEAGRAAIRIIRLDQVKPIIDRKTQDPNRAKWSP